MVLTQGRQAQLVSVLALMMSRCLPARQKAADENGGGTGMRIEDRPTKIGARHLKRLAVVYLRQSSLHQVQHNQESTRLQYNLEAMARELGWEAGRARFAHREHPSRAIVNASIGAT
jgi:hypothetical protein